MQLRRSAEGWVSARALTWELLATWPAAERLGYHSLWSNDEPTTAGLEMLAEFAVAAPRLELGVGVLPLDRHQRAAIAADIAVSG